MYRAGVREGVQNAQTWRGVLGPADPIRPVIRYAVSRPAEHSRQNVLTDAMHTIEQSVIGA